MVADKMIAATGRVVSSIAAAVYAASGDGRTRESRRQQG